MTEDSLRVRAYYMGDDERRLNGLRKSVKVDLGRIVKRHPALGDVDDDRINAIVDAIMDWL